MLRLILSGCNGKMGRVITACVAERCDCEIVAGFDINTESHAGFPVYANPANCGIEADAIIDFSHPSALDGVLAYARDHRLPAVIATTGVSPQRGPGCRRDHSGFLERQYVLGDQPFYGAGEKGRLHFGQ